MSNSNEKDSQSQVLQSAIETLAKIVELSSHPEKITSYFGFFLNY